MTSPVSSADSPCVRWRVLIFPGATEIGLELREALGWCKEVLLYSAGVPGSGHAPFAFARHFPVPSVTEPGWVPALREVITRAGITHVFPAHDDALLALAEHAAELPARIVTSPLATCRIARSKIATLRHLQGVVPVPRLYAQASEVAAFPVFLKPDRGQGAQRTARARDREELVALLREDPDRIIVEHLPGEEYTIDCFSDRERGLLYASGRARRRIRAGIAMDSVVVDDPAFADYARRIQQALPFHGAWFFQLKRDAAGTLKLLEVAPRVGGTSALSRVRGVNLPLLSLYEADRLPCRVEPATYTVEIDRALRNRYRHTLAYRTIYLDFDDTVVVHGRVNVQVISLLFQALNQGVRVVLLTRHQGDLPATLRRYRVDRLFDEIIHLQAGEAKGDYVRDPQSIFIDDSFSERSAVHARTGVPVFSPCMIEALLDERL